jgi:acetyl-CoA C-acetyltransferase
VEFGTTPEQLAWVKVAASRHAQHNPNAMLREPVTVEQVLSSPNPCVGSTAAS